MSAVLLAVYEGHAVAERARTELVRDGFPTDRVELTDLEEPGRAGLIPADSFHGKLARYFQTLFSRVEESHYPEFLVQRIEAGASTVTVHPRGAIETLRARRILEGAGLTELAEHDIENQTLEFAAARYESPWVSALWVESTGHYDCLYCRLFERDAV